MPPKKKRLGELLIDKQVINEVQLSNALKKSNQLGLRLGGALITLGYATEEEILQALSESLNVPFMDISKKVIPVDTQMAFPYEYVKNNRVIPVRRSEDNRMIIVAMEDPTDYAILKQIQQKTGLKIKAVLASSYQVNELMKFFYENGYGKKPCNLAQIKHAEEKMKSLSIDTLLAELVKREGSDLLLSVGAPPSVRINDKVKRLNLPIVEGPTLVQLVTEILTDDQKRELVSNKDIEIAYTKPDLGRFRIVIYRQKRSLSMCARNLKLVVPNIDTLGLPPQLQQFAMKRQGLILITSPAGQGKTTTVASLIDYINEKREGNIITLEDPVEYLHKHKRCNINQREIGEDTLTFSSGMKHIYRQNPDVIMISELRDAESIEIAMNAATTGHLVLSTLNTMDTTSAIDFILSHFPEGKQRIMMHLLSEALLCIVSQRLIPKKTGKDRAVAYEVLHNSSRIATLIRDGKTHQIKSQATTAKGDIEALEYSIASLYQHGIISYENALAYSDDEKRLSVMISMK